MSRLSWVLVASLGLLAYGVLCLLRFPIERQRALAVPRMTCGQLLQNGPVEAEYVTLTDVRLCRGGFASWRDAMFPGDVDVFVPLAESLTQSLLPQQHAPTAFLLLVKSGHFYFGTIYLLNLFDFMVD